MLKTLIKRIAFKFIKPYLFNNSYSQAGEDVVIKFLFDGVGINRPSYLDIGANNPISGNNTFLFYKNGARGVCVEADETLIPAIKKNRPDDNILHCGIGITAAAEAEFYIFADKGLNTFDKEEAEKRDQTTTNKILKKSKVKLQNINTIISENFKNYPDLLSIDIEGWDLKVLQSLDFVKYPIPVICTETCTYSENHIKPKDLRIQELMLHAGYFVYADTYINTIFVNSNWFYSIRK